MARPKARFIVRDGEYIIRDFPCSEYKAKKLVRSWIEMYEKHKYKIVWHETGYGADVQMPGFPRTFEAVPE